jgi:diguanylate cyclase (GGDEF)-like protein
MVKLMALVNPLSPRVIAVYVLTLVFPTWLGAQRYNFRYYSHGDGLRDMEVHSLLQDRQGFIWVGTASGLYRYDGWHFKQYGKAEGLPDGMVISLYETSDGTLFAGTRGGISRKQGERFTAVPLPGSPAISSRSSLASDGEGRVYAATTQGLYIGKSDQSGYSFARYSNPPQAGGTAAYAIYIEPNGAVWFGCGWALCALSNGRVSVYGKEAGVPEERWESILRDRKGTLWIRSPNHVEALRPGSSAFIETLKTDFTSPAIYSVSLHLDPQGRLIVPTESGLLRRARGGWESITVDQGLPTNPTCCVLTDHEGSLWVGMAGAGLARWIGYNEWESWTSAEGLPGNNVQAFHRDGAGNLWVGTSEGLHERSSDARSWKHWTQKQGLGGKSVRAIASSPNGAVWIGYGPGELTRLDPRTGESQQYWLGSERGQVYVIQLMIDAENRLWVVTRGGTFRSDYVRHGARFDRLLPEIMAPDEQIRQVAMDAQGSFWLAASHGLLKLAKGQWTRYTTKDGLRSNDLQFVAAGLDGSIWVGYEEPSIGATRLEFTGTEVHASHFSEANGLKSDELSEIVGDATGRIWVSSTDGLDAFDGHAWQHYGQSQGMVWDDCAGHALYADRDNSIWIGTSRGLSHFTPTEQRELNLPPPVVLTSVHFGTQLKNLADRSEIRYQDRAFQVEYAALAYVNEASVRFRYRMIGLEEGWIRTQEHAARYSTLPPGDYTFEVMAGSTRAQWSTAPSSISFRILPPWWASWWARVSGVTLLLSLLAVAWRWRVRQLLEIQRRLEAAVKERTRELQEQAIKDGLTGLFNRRAFFDILAREFARVERQSVSLAFIMADLDQFKKINDTYGHLAGDAVLQDCARRITASVRPYDSVGRYGGEELVILMPECGLEEAVKRAEQVRSAIAQRPIATPAGTISVTCSFGVSATTSQLTNLEELVELADRALYYAKQQGRNCVMSFPAGADSMGVEEVAETRSRC